MACRILVADDSTTIHKVIRIAFSRYAAEITAVSSFIEAMREKDSLPAELIVVDANLPGTKEPSDFAKLGGREGTVPVIVLVGSYESIDENSLRAAGLKHFIKKPFDSTNIVKAVTKALGRELMPASPASDFTTAPTSHGNLSGVNEGVSLPAEAVLPPPPTLASDHRRGQKAFAEPAPVTVARAVIPPAIFETPTVVFDADDILGSFETPDVALETPKAFPERREEVPTTDNKPMRAAAPSTNDFLTKNLTELVRQSVADYCDQHFNTLAREVITNELKRLAEEKSRHLAES